MWPAFYLGWFAACALLVAPGLLIAWGIGCSLPVALGASSVISVASLSVLAIICSLIGIPVNWAVISLPVVLIGVALCILRTRGRGATLSTSLGFALERRVRARISPVAIAYGLALIAAILTSCFVFVNSIGDPEAFVQNYDNAFHLTRIRFFVDTANYSPFRPSFYPSAWHGLAAMVVSLTGISVPMAESVTNLAFISAAYPLGMVALLAVMFPESPRRVCLGGICCLVFAFFPWRIMLFGPLYPNLASFALLPAVMASFVALFAEDDSLRARLTNGLLFFIGLIALVFAQPNGVFSAALLLIPFLLKRVRVLVRDATEDLRWSTLFSIGAEVLALALIVCLWIALSKAPFMQGVVQYPRPALLSHGQAVKWGLGFSFVIKRQQYFIFAVVALGFLAGLLRDKTRWISASYAIALLFFVVCVSVDGPAKNILTGFWYNDFYRLAATVCIIAVPVAAMGADVIMAVSLFVAGKVGGLLGSAHRARPVGGAVGLLLVAAVLTLNAYPWDFIEQYYKSYGFDAVEYELRDMYGSEKNRSLTKDEVAFLDKVKQEVPASVSVLNQPYDGSVFAYATEDIKVYYNIYGLFESDEHAILAADIDKVSSSPKVVELLRKNHIGYVLQLDQGDGAKTHMNPQGSTYDLGYVKQAWRGINNVNDETPGLTPVLSEGDMRLYRIDAAA